MSDPLQGLRVLERGWLSSNSVLMEGRTPQAPCTLIDSGHVTHAAQTVALVEHALGGRPLAALLNTHLHSDHCGGNAALARRHGMPVGVPATQAEAVAAWDEEALSYRPTGQQAEPFAALHELSHGDALDAAGRRWQWIGAPGHDPHALMLFDAARGVLISGDALWQDGFGVVFPELVGEPGFDDVEAVLDAIAQLPVRLVIPGHGAAFDDVAEALARARARLAGFRADPRRHASHAAKVLVKYHLMEVRRETDAAFDAWARGATLLAPLQARLDAPGMDPVAWAHGIARSLAERGAARREAGGWADA